MIAEDVGWLGRIGEAIDTGLTAEAAVQKVNDDMRARMRPGRRSLPARARARSRGPRQPAAPASAGRCRRRRRRCPPDDFILVARNLGPARAARLRPPAPARRVVLEEGSPNAHVAIVARALDIPVVGQVEDALARIEPGDPLIVDADNAPGLRPPRRGHPQRMFRKQPARRATSARRMFAATREPAGGDARRHRRSALSINAGLLIDLQHLADSGADGVGLYRTEIPFMVRSEFPERGEPDRDLPQGARLGRRQAGGLPHARHRRRQGDALLAGAAEENPAMGWRAIRIGARPAGDAAPAAARAARAPPPAATSTSCSR